MKIVVLTSRFPYPIEKGDKLRMYHQLKFLAKIHEIHLISITHDAVHLHDIDHLKSICAKVSVIKTSRLKSVINAGLGIFNSLPFQVNFFFSKAIKREVEQLVSDFKPHVIYCQLIRMSEYVKNLPYPKVLDYMDAFSLNYSRRVKHEYALGKFFFRKEAKRLAKYEDVIYNSFEETVIISKNDHEQVGKDKNITVISNGLDTNFFSPGKSEPAFDMVFVGNMGYHPNILSAKFLVRKVLPLLSSELSLQIAGARPSTAVKALESEKVKISGWIDDIRDAYRSSKLFVAPIFSGAGQQNKILEAMSMELICITTSIVNEAIQAKEGKEILIADSAQEFADQIAKVMKNIDLYEEIGTNARKFVQSKFSWENENNKLNEVLLRASKESKNEI